MGIMFPCFKELVTGGAIGDGLFFFCSGFTLFLGRPATFPNWYKRRVNRIYPTIIVWALLSTLIFGWDWTVADLVFTPRYWFIPCVMVYYAIFYLIRTYLMDKLKVVAAVTLAVVAVSSVWILDRGQSVMYSDVRFMRVYYFTFMLLGAMTALRKMQAKPSASKSLWLTFACLVAYYFCMGLYKVSPFFCNFQIVSLFPLLGAIYYLYLFSQSEWVHKMLERKVLGGFIYAFSALTLEVYMVQRALLVSDFNAYFPLNIFITFVVVIIAAYVLKVFSNLFTQVFSDKPFDAYALIRL